MEGRGQSLWMQPLQAKRTDGKDDKIGYLFIFTYFLCIETLLDKRINKELYRFIVLPS